MARPTKKEEIPVEKKEIQPAPQPIPQPQEHRSYFNKQYFAKYECPNCHTKHEERALGNALIIESCLCARCRCKMRLEIK